MQRRIHHVGITVSDLDSAAEFYRNIVDGTIDGPYEKSGPAIDAVTGHAGVVVRQAFIETAGGDTLIELLEYRGGSTTRLDPDNGHIAAVHVAILLDDLDATLDRLAASGVEAISAPIIATTGPLDGHRLLYVLGPDRVRVELIEPPH